MYLKWQNLRSRRFTKNILKRIKENKYATHEKENFNLFGADIMVKELRLARAGMIPNNVYVDNCAD